jgi:hypothetical protein
VKRTRFNSLDPARSEEAAVILRALIVAALILASQLEALATPITFTLTGNVDTVSPELAGTFNTTQTMSGSYTFESLSPDLSPGDSTIGQYSPLVPNSLSFTVGTYSGGRVGPVDPSDVIQVRDSFSDEYFLNWGPPLNGPNAGTLSPVNFVAFLTDFTGTAFGSDALPSIPPNLAAFSVRRWGVNFAENGNCCFVVSGGITSLELAPVPEPATLLLLGTTAASLGLARWRQRRRQQ